MSDGAAPPASGATYRPPSRTVIALKLAPFAIVALPTLYFMAGGGPLGLSVVALYLAGIVALLWKLPLRTGALVMVGAGIGIAWFVFAEPRADRDWRTEVARQPTATIEGEWATVHDVRHFRYRSADDFDIRYEDRTYDLRKLDSVDLLLSYWDGNTRIAHTMLSFGFGGEEYLCLSVEIRPEKGEDWSTLGAVFQQFEIVYVLADERDAIGVRAGPRGEEVYLYPLAFTPEQIRDYFRLVLARCNELAAAPEFYDPIDYNCSAALTLMADQLWPERARQSGLDAYLNGNIDRNAHEGGLIASDLPFEELRARSLISPAGRERADAADFSQRIRAGLPGR